MTPLAPLGPGTTPVLQFASLPGGTVQFGLTVVSSVLGLAVGYVAFRGYRRNESLPMLFVATGFLLAFWTPVLLLAAFVAVETVGEFAPGVGESVYAAVGLAGEASRIVGLVCILYGLAMPLRGGEAD